MNLQHNKIIHLEDSMFLYGINNPGTLEKLINIAHKMHNFMTPNEELFASTLSSWYNWYLTKAGINHYAINSLIPEHIKRKIC